MSQLPLQNNLDNLPYRLGVGVMLLNTHNRVFVGKRIDTTLEAWQMPQGGIDEGEEPFDSAKRELYEETGITKAELICESKEWLTYDLPLDILPQIWGGKYRGQKQKWFLMRFLGNEAEIDLQATHPEFLAYQWLEANQLPHVIVPFKKRLYERILEEFDGKF